MIERATDYRRVRKFRPGNVDLRDSAIYLIDVEDGEDIGVWYFGMDYHALSMHASMTTGGARAAQSAREALAWIFGNTAFRVVTAAIPRDQRHVRAMACHIGFEAYAIDQDGNCCYFFTAETLERKAKQWAA